MWVWNGRQSWRPKPPISIKRCYLAQFLIKQLYTRPEVVTIIFYHRPHTWTNSEPAHGKHDLDSITQPSFFAPQMSQAFKDHIWTQLDLSNTIKQICDKHKAIWWARINAREAMTRDDFIKKQNIVYLSRKHKKNNLVFTQKSNHFPSHMGI